MSGRPAPLRGKLGDVRLRETTQCGEQDIADAREYG